MSKQLMIIGGGPAATHAAETIRQFDDKSQVTMICDEPAHSRMALPYWLCGKIPPEQMHTGNTDHFRQWNITWRGDVGAGVEYALVLTASVGVEAGGTVVNTAYYRSDGVALQTASDAGFVVRSGYDIYLPLVLRND